MYFALGEEVIFVDRGVAYQITTGPGGVAGLPADFDPVGEEPVPENPVKDSLVSGWRSLCSLPWLVGLALFGWAWRR
jgi:hypothetical protein